jgi:hypothetical protein
LSRKGSRLPGDLAEERAEDMKKILGHIGAGLLYLGGAVICLDLLYSEWILIRESFFNFINPLTQVMALFNMLFFPITWIGFAMVLTGFWITHVMDHFPKEPRSQEN